MTEYCWAGWGGWGGSLSSDCHCSDWLVECCFTSTETVGFLRTGAQDGHLDFHTAAEVCSDWSFETHFMQDGGDTMADRGLSMDLYLLHCQQRAM